MGQPRIGIGSELCGPAGQPLLRGLLDVFEGVEAEAVPLGTAPDAASLRGLDAVMFEAAPPDPEALISSGTVRAIGRLAVGYDDIPIDVLAKASIGYLNAPTAFAREVARAALTLLLSVAGRLPERQAMMRQGHAGWAMGAVLEGHGLFGRTLGVFGPGAIGQAVFELTAPFGFRRLASGRHERPDLARRLGFDYVDLDTLCREADVLVLACPLTEATRGAIDARRLALMRQTAILVNVARGPVVVEADLIHALQEGRIAGAGLDVFSEEPTSPDNPPLNMQQVTASPHGLAVNGDGYRAACTEVLSGLLAYLAGGRPANLVATDRPDTHDQEILP
jgi:phosphoglycerate dehydrogenase-like enzyme